MSPKDPRQSWNPEVRLAVLEAEVSEQKRQLIEVRDDLCGDKPQSATSRLGVLETDKAEARASFRTAVAIVSAVVTLGTGAVLAEVRSLKDAVIGGPKAAGVRPASTVTP